MPKVPVDFTLDYPERVTALIPVAAGLGGFQTPPTPDEQALWDEYDHRYEARDWDWIVDTETAFWVDGPRQPADRVPAAIRNRVHEWIAQGYRDHLEEDPTAESLEPPAVNRLREIKVPTLVMVGDLDEGGTIQACRKLATDIPGARFELFEGGLGGGEGGGWGLVGTVADLGVEPGGVGAEAHPASR